MLEYGIGISIDIGYVCTRGALVEWYRIGQHGIAWTKAFWVFTHSLGRLLLNMDS